jgi:LmbE family N-acetylglucosaminyl deacetylase
MDLRTGAQVALNAWHAWRFEEVSDEQLRADAWIIAPHPDDEVLGCGGTIARKVTLGARVRVCFLTDGSASHPQWIDKAQLRALRREEALAACATLGVASEDITFLDFEDRTLAEHLDEAATRLRRCFEQAPRIEVYAPHHREQPLDHRAACWIAQAAMRGLTVPSAYLEYPVWRWYEWPWIEAPVDRGARSAVDAARAFARSVQLLRECRWRVPIGEVRDQKRRALEAHKTQVFGLDGVADCPTLSDVAGGDFLKRFFATHEIFARYEHAAQQKIQWPKLTP